VPKLSTCASYVSRARGRAINSPARSLWLSKLYRFGGRLKCPGASDVRNYPRMKMQRSNNGWYPNNRSQPFVVISAKNLTPTFKAREDQSERRAYISLMQLVCAPLRGRKIWCSAAPAAGRLACSRASVPAQRHRCIVVYNIITLRNMLEPLPDTYSRTLPAMIHTVFNFIVLVCRVDTQTWNI